MMANHESGDSLWQDGECREFAEAAGGVDNIDQLEACVTRLRVALKDKALANKRQLGRLTGVRGIIEKPDGLHLIIGVEVIAIYRRCLQVLGLPEYRPS